MSHNPFVHLHVHSHFSLLDGCIHQKDLVAKASSLDMPALALTDHGSLFGSIAFYLAARKQGIKPIIGLEAYVAKTSRFEKDRVDGQGKSNHITLLARNEEGYKNLIKLTSLGFVEGFYRKPRIDHELLQRHQGGLIALSGCMGGAIPQAIAAGDIPQAEELGVMYREIFGPENFYFELMRNGVSGQGAVNEVLVELGRKNRIPLVATNDVHYLDRSDALVHEVMLCINTGQTLRDQNRMKLETDEFYFRSSDEMARLFEDLPEAVENTLSIASRCNLELCFDQLHLPEFKVDTGEEPAEYLRKLCYEGAGSRFDETTGEIRERLESELGVITSMGFATYFLIVWDFIKYARDHGIPVGPGRGSAAGSLVAYCLRITEVNPLKYDLIFERFLNSSRISMPDIDIDFCRDGREKVIRYVQEKYGAQNVCQIVTFGTMAARAAVRDAGRVLGIDLQTVDGIAKKIPMVPKTKLKDALEMDPDLQALYKSSQEITELFDISRKIEGLNRHASTHAAGVVITDKPLTDYVPLCRVQNDINTQYQMGDLEKIGLLKMDFLGLKNLTIMDKAGHLMRERTGSAPDLSKLPLDDEQTFRLLQSGRTLGIFQLESEGMSNLLVRLKPDTFEDIIALLALYRPGPLNSGMVDSYVRRKHGQEEVEYLHHSLKEVLRETYGVIVYQEQVMRIANILAGFSLNDADSLRKAMGKKIPEVMAKFRDMFVEGSVKNSVDPQKAGEIYDMIEYFAGYGFNKSHSTAYGIITYQTAFLKANHPLEFMAALMSCDASNTDKIAEYREECERMGIKVLGPDLNESAHDFTISGEEAIRFGLSAIKGIGDKAIESILESRKGKGTFSSLRDFLLEVELKMVNKSALEALIKAGAFDFAKSSRAACLGMLEMLIRWAAGVQADRRSGQKGLFGTGDGETEMMPIPEKEEWDEDLKLAYEKEALGFIISVDPLKKYAHLLKYVASGSAGGISETPDGARVTLGGIVYGLHEHLPKSGKGKGKKMALFKIRVPGGHLSGVAFRKEYEKYRALIEDDRFCIFTGSVDKSRADPVPTLKVTHVCTMDEAIKARCSALIVRIGTVAGASEALVERIKAAAEGYPGASDLILYIEAGGKKAYTVKAGERYRLELGQALILKMEGIVGKGNVELR